MSADRAFQEPGQKFCSTRDAIFGGGLGSRSSISDHEERVPSEVDQGLVSSLEASDKPSPGGMGARSDSPDDVGSSCGDKQERDNDDCGSRGFQQDEARETVEPARAATDTGYALSDGDVETDNVESHPSPPHGETDS